MFLQRGDSGAHFLTCLTAFPTDMKPRMEISLQYSERTGQELRTSQASNSTKEEDMEDEEDDEDEETSDPSATPIPYLQGPPPDGSCTLDGTPTIPQCTASPLPVSSSVFIYL